MLLLNNLKCKI